MNIILFSEKDRKDSREFVFYKNDERYLHIKKVLHLDLGSSFKCGIIAGKYGKGLITRFTGEELCFNF